MEAKNNPEYTVILNNVEDGIYKGAEFNSYDEFQSTFNRWCDERNVRFTKLHSQTIEGANKWMKPGNAQYDPGLKYKSLRLACFFSDRKFRKGDAEDGRFRKKNATGCEACIVLNVTRNNMTKLVVKMMNMNHNHELLPFDEPLSSPSLVHRERSHPSKIMQFPEIYQQPISNLMNKETSPEGDPAILHCKDSDDILGHQPIAKFLNSIKRNPVPRKRSPPVKLLNHSTSKNGKNSQASRKETGQSYSTPMVQGSTPATSIPLQEQNHTLLQLLEAERNMDEEDIFCRSLMNKLRLLDEETRSRTKIQIQTLIHNALFSNSPLSMHVGIDADMDT